MDTNTRLLRHKPSGQLFVYQEAFAQRADFEEVTPEPAAKPARAPRKARAAEDEAPGPTAEENAEAIGLDASRNLP